MINSGILGAVTLAVAATSVHAWEKPSGLTQGSGSSSSTTGGSSSSHTSGFVDCSSDAMADLFVDWQDAYAAAVTSVVADICKVSWYTYYDIYDQTDIHDFAYALAEIVVDAGAECVSGATDGAKVEGCAFAEASTYAWSYAFVDVHAEASAAAIAEYCTLCGSAASFTWAYGSIAQELTTEAYGNVDVAACVSGNDYAKATGNVDCWADIYAHAMATSFSRAMLDSDWWSTCNTDALSFAQISVDSWVYENNQCTFIEYAEGLTSVNTGGGSSTRVYNNQ